MRKLIVAGNWKMNGNQASIEALLSGLKASEPLPCEVLVFPTSVYLTQVMQQLSASQIGTGAQNLDWHDSGAFTGEVSAGMLRDVGVTHVLTGHSERRHLFGETDDMVAAKTVAALASDLTPIVCVGETLEERQANKTLEVIERQIAVVLDRTGQADLGRCVIAYEPVWAIGTGESATPAQAGEVHQWIRRYVESNSEGIAEDLRILYGGSVNAANAADLFAMEDIDGALVGGASLNASDFVTICRAADRNIQRN